MNDVALALIRGCGWVQAEHQGMCVVPGPWSVHGGVDSYTEHFRSGFYGAGFEALELGLVPMLVPSRLV